jgi:hypothetical protein
LGLKILWVGLLVFVLDAALGSGLRRLYFGMRWGKFARVTYALDKTSEQILFFGSSRAYTHYVPEVFEEKMGRRSYNVGHDAAGMLYHVAMLEGILTRYRPETIFLDFRPDELAENVQGFQVLSDQEDHPPARSGGAAQACFEDLSVQFPSSDGLAGESDPMVG